MRTLSTHATTLLRLPRDIVARGRTLTRIALALLLAPQLLMLLIALPAGAVSVVGETARAVVWIGLLYLVYRGFRFTRWLVLLVATMSGIAWGAMVVRNVVLERRADGKWYFLEASTPVEGP